MPKFNYQPDEQRTRKTLTTAEYDLIHGLDGLGKLAPFVRRMVADFLQPIDDAKKDVVDTIKPYRGWYQSNRDFLRPLYGIRNLIQSAIGFIFAGITIALLPIALIIGVGAWLVINLFSDEENKTEYNDDLKSNTLDYFEIMLSFIMRAVEFAIRGITQIATTPLDWFIKMPLRGLITWIKGVAKFEERGSVQRLYKEGQELLDGLNNVGEYGSVDKQDNFRLYTIVKALNIKLLDGVEEKKQQTNINLYSARDTSSDIFSGFPVKKSDLRECLMLFAPKNNPGSGGNIPNDNLRNDMSYKS